MSKYTRGLLAVILAVVLVLPAAAFAMLPEANARSSTGMDGPTATKIVDPDTTSRWQYWASGGEQDQTTRYVGRIWTDKTVEPAQDEKSDFVTTLSTISSTSDTTSLVTKPLDIVMVLDASGSMGDDMGGSDSTKRIDALKAAASSFIDTIAEQNAKIKDDSKQHQVSIVKFAGTKSYDIGNGTYSRNKYNYSQVMKGLTPCVGSDATELKNTVGHIEPAGATQADYGLELARDMSGRTDAQKVVVFFTDGSPTSSNGFESDVANDAVNAAKTMKDKGATIYTIGIFSGANPDQAISKASKENKFMHAVSNNYPNATSYTTNKLGKRTENSDFYKAASNADELKKVFDDISSSITSGKGSPTQIEDGYDESKSGYITFSDELGDFMQVDTFVSAQINGVPFDEVTKTTKGNTDTYEFSGVAKDLVITVERSTNAQQGDIVTVKIPASLIPLIRYHVDMENGIFERTSLNDIKPIQIKYTSSVKDAARNNLFTPDDGLKKYIEKHKGADNQTVYFLANKWSGGELGDVVADVLAALVEDLELVLGQVERVDLLDAPGADHARQGGKDALLSILAGHERGGGKHGVLVVQHGGADARGGVGDGVLGALLALVGHIAALARELLDLHVVKGVLVGVLGLKLVEALAGDGRGLKGSQLAKAVLANHVGVDGLGAHTDLLGNLGAQAGGIQTAARADDLLGIVAGQVPQLGAHDVAGVGDAHEDAVKAGVDDALGKGAGGVGGKEQLAVAVAGGQCDLAGGVDDDVAAGQLLVVVVAVDDLGVVRDKRKGVAQVLDLGCHLGLVDIAQVQLVGDALHEQAVGDMCSYVALADHTDLTRLVHICIPSAEFFASNHCSVLPPLC